MRKEELLEKIKDGTVLNIERNAFGKSSIGFVKGSGDSYKYTDWSEDGAIAFAGNLHIYEQESSPLLLSLVVGSMEDSDEPAPTVIPTNTVNTEVCWIH